MGNKNPLSSTSSRLGSHISNMLKIDRFKMYIGNTFLTADIMYYSLR